MADERLGARDRKIMSVVQVAQFVYKEYKRASQGREELKKKCQEAQEGRHQAQAAQQQLEGLVQR